MNELGYCDKLVRDLTPEELSDLWYNLDARIQLDRALLSYAAARVLEACIALTDDIRGRYNMAPDEPFDCPYMQAVATAIAAAQGKETEA